MYIGLLFWPQNLRLDRTIALMHSINLISEEATPTLDAVIVELVPFRCGSDFWAREFCERMEGQAVDHEEGCVAEADDRYVYYLEHYILFRWLGQGST